MDKAKARAVIDAINAIMTPTEGPWQAKRDAIMAEASEQEQGHLYEFSVWFTDEDEDDEEEAAKSITDR